MKRILVIGEDALSCALGERLVATGLPEWSLARASINTRGVTDLKKNLPRYLEQARHVQPVLCVADTDGHCAVELIRNWLPLPEPGKLLLRLAVTEAESWLLADREGFAHAFEVPVGKLPRDPDSERNPKELLLTLARRSRRRLYRDELVSADDHQKPGSGYNLHLSEFARSRWNVVAAAARSMSLQRALNQLEGLA